MTMGQDFADILAVVGAPSDGTAPGLLTVVRRSDVFSDSGSGTPTFTQVDQQEGSIQPYLRRGGAETKEAGIEVANEFVIFLPSTTNILEADRVRGPGWVAGQDEYYVQRINALPPSHIEVVVTKATGHAS